MKTSYKICSLVAVLAAILAFTFVACSSGPKGTGAPETVTLLGFNDFHGALPERARETGNPGLAKLAGKMLALVAEDPEHTVVLAAGDNYQGTDVSNLNFGKPASDIFKIMGVKYSAVGNHEFDWYKSKPGDFYFKDWERDTGMPFLAANIVDNATGEIPSDFKPYAILDVGGIKIGLIGIATPKTAVIVVKRNIDMITFTDPVEATKKYYNELVKKGVNAVVALTHLDSYQDADGVVTGDAAVLANAVPQLAAIISGHSHRAVNGVVNGVPIVQAETNGTYIDRLDLSFDANGVLTGVTGSLYNLSDAEGKANAPVNEEALAIIKRYTDELAPLMQQVVGKNDKALETKPEVADWMCHIIYDYILRTEGKAYITTENDGGVRSQGIPLPAGDLTTGYFYGLMPFENTIVLMDVTGAELTAILDRPTAELISKTDYYGVTKVNGTYQLLDGTPIDPAKTYGLMCNDFMYTGGDNFDFSAGKNVRMLSTSLRDAMIEEAMFRAGLLK